MGSLFCFIFFFFQAEDGIRDTSVTGVQTCALPISRLELEACRTRNRRSAVRASARGALSCVSWPGDVRGDRSDVPHLSAQADLSLRKEETRGMKRSFARVAAAFLAVCAIVPAFAAAPSYVDITWFSISNLYLQVGPLGIIADGYITRIPASAFFGGGGGLARTHQAYTPDVAGVTRVLTALGGPSSGTLLLTRHRHFDHSFDTAT